MAEGSKYLLFLRTFSYHLCLKTQKNMKGAQRRPKEQEKIVNSFSLHSNRLQTYQ